MGKLILCRMARIVDVSSICSESISLEGPPEGNEAEGPEGSGAGVGERKRDSWGEEERRRLRLLPAAALTLVRAWRRVEGAIGSDGSSG